MQLIFFRNVIARNEATTLTKNTKFDSASEVASFLAMTKKQIKKAQHLSYALVGYYIWFVVLSNLLKSSSLFNISGFKTFFKPVHSLF